MIPMTPSVPKEDEKLRANVTIQWEGMRIRAEVYEHTEEEKTLVDEFKVISIENLYNQEPIEATVKLKGDILQAYLDGETYIESGVFL